MKPVADRAHGPQILALRCAPQLRKCMRGQACQARENAVAADRELRQEPVKVRRQDRHIGACAFYRPPVVFISHDRVAALLDGHHVRQLRKFDQCFRGVGSPRADRELEDRQWQRDRVGDGANVGQRHIRRARAAGGKRAQRKHGQDVGAGSLGVLRLGDCVGRRVRRQPGDQGPVGADEVAGESNYVLTLLPGKRRTFAGMAVDENGADAVGFRAIPQQVAVAVPIDIAIRGEGHHRCDGDVLK